MPTLIGRAVKCILFLVPAISANTITASILPTSFILHYYLSPLISLSLFIPSPTILRKIVLTSISLISLYLLIPLCIIFLSLLSVSLLPLYYSSLFYLSIIPLSLILLSIKPLYLLLTLYLFIIPPHIIPSFFCPSPLIFVKPIHLSRSASPPLSHTEGEKTCGQPDMSMYKIREGPGQMLGGDRDGSVIAGEEELVAWAS
jgi:hypothetical protein